MANRPAPYTQADVTRAVKGAVAAGLTVREVIATVQGVRVICSDEKPRKPQNEWDEVCE
ncbi:hypothetical protein [Nitratireductor sp. ZSWI3]|uniref:hypothetical protein n=1 Tax=Nitratireductor sp. ZSWI3 TaxID=2966359 RepID=UPI00214FBD1D|nr:hypothetical protein [Nitratireductor sp. ZSWI3]MCR4267097.1 hypothetical protein [Nitratireductor sp. ZSWI3]